MKNKKILILDDDENYLFLVSRFIKNLNCKVVQADSYPTALSSIGQMDIDAYILDIELQNRQMEGIKVAEEIRKIRPDAPIIFLTSHYLESYYEQCRHLRPSAFLSKELSRFKLYQALDLAFLHNHNFQINPPPKESDTFSTKTPILQANNKQYFFKIGNKYKSYPIEEILYFFADGKLSYAHIEGRNYPTKVQLKVLEEELHPQFVRVHKKYLVNQLFIQSINTKEMTIEINKETIPIGYTYKKDFLARMNLLK